MTGLWVALAVATVFIVVLVRFEVVAKCIVSQSSSDIWRYLQIFAGIFRYLAVSSDICRHLQISAGIFRYLQISPTHQQNIDLSHAIYPKPAAAARHPRSLAYEAQVCLTLAWPGRTESRPVICRPTWPLANAGLDRSGYSEPCPARQKMRHPRESGGMQERKKERKEKEKKRKKPSQNTRTSRGL